MYSLAVYYSDEGGPTHIEYPANANDALARVSVLLEAHPDCHRIAVRSGLTQLFAVDRKGERLADSF